MLESSSEKPKSPIDQFDQKTAHMTDFREYLILLVHEGVPALVSMIAQKKIGDSSEGRLEFAISFATYRVLKNREEMGLPNNMKDLFPSEIEPLMKELLPIDKDIRDKIGRGLLQGLVYAGVIKEPKRGFRKEFMLLALPILDKWFSSKELHCGQLAGLEIAETLGISEEEAGGIVVEYSMASIHNELPGDTIQLPETRILAPEESLTKLETNSAWFTMGYVQQRIDIEPAHPFEMLGLLEQSRFWLGNGDKETKTLVTWMEENPDKVADYLDWVFGKPQPGQIDFAEEFRAKAKQGKLKDVRFE